MSESKLVRLYVERKFLLPLRLVLFLAALPFLWDIYNAFDTGFIVDGRLSRIRSEGMGFYIFLLKKIVIAAVFIWVSTGGLKEKKPDSSENKPKE